jgi:hypothetical protein
LSDTVRMEGVCSGQDLLRRVAAARDVLGVVTSEQLSSCLQVMTRAIHPFGKATSLEETRFTALSTPGENYREFIIGLFEQRLSLRRKEIVEEAGRQNLEFSLGLHGRVMKELAINHASQWFLKTTEPRV